MSIDPLLSIVVVGMVICSFVCGWCAGLARGAKSEAEEIRRPGTKDKRRPRC